MGYRYNEVQCHGGLNCSRPNQTDYRDKIVEGFIYQCWPEGAAAGADLFMFSYVLYDRVVEELVACGDVIDVAA